MNTSNTPQQAEWQAALEAAMAAVHGFVRERLEAGLDAAALNYALAYVAADMGIAAAPSPLDAMACALAGLQSAVAVASSKPAAESLSIEENAVPASRTIH